MKTTTPRLLLPWLSLPLVAAAHLLLWDRLPERLAVQFGPGGTPTNWMTRGQSLAFDLAILLFILLLGNWAVRRRPGQDRHTGLFRLYFAVIVVTLVFLVALKYNATGSLF